MSALQARHLCSHRGTCPKASRMPSPDLCMTHTPVNVRLITCFTSAACGHIPHGTLSNPAILVARSWRQGCTSPVTGLVVCATKAYLAGMTDWQSTAIWRCSCCSPALRRLDTALEFHLDAHTALMARHMSFQEGWQPSHSKPAGGGPRVIGTGDRGRRGGGGIQHWLS